MNNKQTGAAQTVPHSTLNQPVLAQASNQLVAEYYKLVKRVKESLPPAPPAQVHSEVETAELVLLHKYFSINFLKEYYQQVSKYNLATITTDDIKKVIGSLHHCLNIMAELARIKNGTALTHLAQQYRGLSLKLVAHCLKANPAFQLSIHGKVALEKVYAQLLDGFEMGLAILNVCDPSLQAQRQEENQILEWLLGFHIQYFGSACLSNCKKSPLKSAARMHNNILRLENLCNTYFSEAQKLQAPFSSLLTKRADLIRSVLAQMLLNLGRILYGHVKIKNASLHLHVQAMVATIKSIIFNPATPKHLQPHLIKAIDDGRQVAREVVTLFREPHKVKAILRHTKFPFYRNSLAHYINLPALHQLPNKGINLTNKTVYEDNLLEALVLASAILRRNNCLRASQVLNGMIARLFENYKNDDRQEILKHRALHAYNVAKCCGMAALSPQQHLDFYDGIKNQAKMLEKRNHFAHYACQHASTFVDIFDKIEHKSEALLRDRLSSAKILVTFSDDLESRWKVCQEARLALELYERKHKLNSVELLRTAMTLVFHQMAIVTVFERLDTDPGKKYLYLQKFCDLVNSYKGRAKHFHMDPQQSFIDDKNFKEVILSYRRFFKQETAVWLNMVRSMIDRAIKFQQPQPPSATESTPIPPVPVATKRRLPQQRRKRAKKQKGSTRVAASNRTKPRAKPHAKRQAKP